jgi:protein-L-isoaspartate O-methyltransferase
MRAAPVVTTAWLAAFARENAVLAILAGTGYNSTV